MPQLKTLFVLADGGRARLVERSAETGAFTTFEEMTAPNRKHPRHGPRPERGVDDVEPGRQDKEAFAAEVAARAAQVCAARGMQRVCVSAPPRLVGAFRSQLERTAVPNVILERDLAKTPDHALGRWLNHLPPA